MHLWRPEKGIKAPEAIATCSCGLPSMSDWTKLEVLCKSSTYT